MSEGRESRKVQWIRCPREGRERECRFNDLELAVVGSGFSLREGTEG